MLKSLLETVSAVLAPAVAERLTLLVNRVLQSEPVGTQRLSGHIGRSLRLQLDRWPALLPAPPELRWVVTPAGLLEWVGATGAPASDLSCDLTLRMDASNPAALLMRGAKGEIPQVQLEGDAAFAADLNWLMQNLRWDVAAELERLFGPALAHQVHQLGRRLAAGVKASLEAASEAGQRLRAWRG